jgi:hypothetical protein
MHDRTLRNLVALAFLAAHIAMLGQLSYLWYTQNKFQFTQVLDAALIITPMFSAYLVTMLRYVFFSPPNPPLGVRRNGTYLIATAIIVGAFFAALFALAQVAATGHISFDWYKRGLAAVDAVFAGYLSIIMMSMFEKPPGPETIPDVSFSGGKKVETVAISGGPKS